MLYGVFRFLIIVLALIGLGSVVVAAYLMPHFDFFAADAPAEEQTVTFLRLTDREVQREVLFSTPCDPGGPHLYLGDGKDIRLPLYLRWPGDLPTVDESDYAAPGNRFLIEGYPVARTTGEAITPALYFDVIAWSPISPYRVWKRDGDDLIEDADVTEPVSFRSSLSDPIFELSSASPGSGC